MSDPRRKNLPLALAIAAIAWLLYAPTLGADFVGDARAKVLISDFIHKPAQNLPILLTGRILSRDEIDFNRPGNLLSLMADAAIWGKNPLGYHLTSITLHAAVCALLFLLILRLSPAAADNKPPNPWPAFLATLAYAVHPLNCEPVAEVSYREDLLVTSSILIAVFLAMAFLRKPSFWRNLAIAAACVLALLFSVSCKENGAAGPVILAGYWWFWRRKDPPSTRRPWLLLIASAFAVVTAFLIARFALAPAHSVIFTAPASRLGGTFLGTLHIQPRIWAMELSQIIAPFNLCADYGPYTLRNYQLTWSVIAVLLFIAAQLWLASRHRIFAFGALFFWAGILPVSNLVPLFKPMADRFLYLPMIGIAITAAHALALLNNRPFFRTGIFILMGIWISIATCITSLHREPIWKDSLTLWTATAAENPYSEDAANNLGWAWFQADEFHPNTPMEGDSREDRLSSATRSFYDALRLSNGHDPDPFAGLSLVSDQLGDHALANGYFLKAVALDPRYAHPQQLVRALTAEPDIAAHLQLLAQRNPIPQPTPH